MEVKNCRSCGRLFNYIGGGYQLCPACVADLDKKFGLVKQYIRDTPYATMPQIAEENNVSIAQLERWVREERLTFADDSPIGIECEGCGTTIKTGRFCSNCKDNMAKGLSYKSNTGAVKKSADREKARMRFLDNQ